MTPYRPAINTDSYTLTWLRDRAAMLVRLLTGGTKMQRRSIAAAAELAAITAALAERTLLAVAAPVVAVAVPAPVALRPAVRMSYTPAPLRTSGAYTDALQAVCATPSRFYTYR